MERKNVVIIGAGLMGSGIAAISALAGNATILVDKNIEAGEKGVAGAKRNILTLLDNALATAEDAQKAEKLLSATNDMKAALKEANLVIEAIYENLQMKQEIFKAIDEELPADIPILSNTSGLRITDIAKEVKYPERTMTAHFWYPAHLVPLVEVVMSEKTDETMAVQVKQRLAQWGKAPVLVKKDLPGQLANRILQAIIRESVDIVASGLATPEDVDTAIKMGMGIRFPVWGPLEHIDAVGLDLASSVQNTVLPDINADKKANAYLEELVEGGNLGCKTGKGIYDWSKKDIKELEKRRDEFIMYALKKSRGV